MSERKKIVFVGGGEHARVLIDLISLAGEYEIAGLLDPNLKQGSRVSDITVLGSDDLLPSLKQQGINDICIGIGSIMDNSKREEAYHKVKELNFNVPPLVHPASIVADRVKIMEGVQIMAGVIIQIDSIIRENSIINTGAIIDHDCTIGKNVHISPGAVVSGGSYIGDNSFLGAGSTVRQGIRIGNGVTVGAGSLVINDLPDLVTVMGVPAK